MESVKIKPKTQDIGKQIVQITPDGQGRIGTIVGINRKVIFINYGGRGAVESAKRENLHWYGNGKKEGGITPPERPAGQIRKDGEPVGKENK